MKIGPSFFKRIACFVLLFALLTGCGTDGAEVGSTPASPQGSESAEELSGNQADSTGNAPSDAAGRENGEPDDSDDGTSTEAEQPEEQSGGQATAGRTPVGNLFANAVQSAENLASFSTNAEAVQRIVQNGAVTTIDQSIRMDVILAPEFIARMESSTDMGGGGSLETAMIITDSSVYMKIPLGDSWMEMPVDMSMSLDQAGVDADSIRPIDQLRQLEPYLDSILAEETAEGYRLKLEASGDAFRELLQDQLKEQGDNAGLMDDLFAAFGQLNVNEVLYDIVLEKGTFFPLEMTVKFDYDMEMDGSRIQFVSEVRATYSNHNNVKEIRLPDKVISSDNFGFDAFW